MARRPTQPRRYSFLAHLLGVSGEVGFGQTEREGEWNATRMLSRHSSLVQGTGPPTERAGLLPKL